MCLAVADERKEDVLMGLLRAVAVISDANTRTGEIGDDVVVHSVKERTEIVECRCLHIGM